jgi:serine protease
VVVGAGDDSEDPAERSPTSCSGVVAVAASSRAGGLTSYSNAGPIVHLSAPGGNGTFIDDDIWSTVYSYDGGPDSFSYASYNGTVMAAAHVAGAAVLVRAANPNLDPNEVRDILIETTRPFASWCDGCGSGLLDAGRAVEAAREML